MNSPRRNRRARRAPWALAGVLALLSVVAVAPAGATGAGGLALRVVASGLANPKHLTIAPNGQVDIVESGLGGATGTANCATGPSTGGTGTTSYCEGPTGAIASWSPATGLVTRVRALPSVIETDIGEAAGPAAVAFARGSTAIVFQDELVGPTGANTLTGPAATTFGTLEIFTGGHRHVVNLAAFAASHPQAAATLGGPPHAETTYDSDPYDVVPYLNGFAVVDAAANDLLFVSASGAVSVLARFPTVAQPVPAGALGNPTAITIDGQAVPTAVVVGPDGALYVSTLSGVPSEPGTARVYRVTLGSAPTVYATGLTAVTALAFDGSTLLATEYSTGGLLAPPTVPGALVAIAPNGHETTLPLAGLVDPTGIAVAPNGVILIANHGSAPSAQGQLVEVTGSASGLSPAFGGFSWQWGVS